MLLGASSDELFLEGVEVEGEDSLFFAVPGDVGGEVFHYWLAYLMFAIIKLAVSQLMNQWANISLDSIN